MTGIAENAWLIQAKTEYWLFEPKGLFKELKNKS